MSRWRLTGPARALSGERTVPGDKSIGHRAVMFAALADGKVRVAGLSGGEDNHRTVAALQALGVPIIETGPGSLEVSGVGLDGLRAAAGDLDCGNSGTSIRLLSGMLAPRHFRSRLVGDEYLNARPMRRVVDPLQRMGAHIEGHAGKKSGEIYPPLTVGGATGLHGVRWVSKVASAQVKSAILMAGMLAEGPTTVVEPSLSRDHTERLMRSLGVPLAVHGLEVTLDPRGWDRRMPAHDLHVPGDLSSGAFLLAAATLVPGSRVTVRGVGVNATRTGFFDALRAMGGDLTLENQRDQGGEPVADVTARAAQLRGTEIAGELSVRAIDELPLLAALAAHADGETVIRDAAELRVKESDRVASTAAMLTAFGATVEERPDGLVISGRARHPGVVDSHGDHRIAMAGAVCALAVSGETTVLDTENVATSFPGFAEALAALGAAIA
jgi:3-phosphoshikimate 1-carboxyvinyltransferase